MKKGITKIPGATIGILSGMGPLAGSDLLQKVLAYAAHAYGAVDDAEYPDILLVSHGFEGFDAQGTLGNGLEQQLQQVISQLQAGGSSIAGIACNTAHIYLESLQRSTTVPLVNLPMETAKAAARHQGNFLLLTSHAAREAGLYPAALTAQRVSFTELNDHEQQLTDEVIELVMAHKLAEAGQKITTLVAGHAGQVDGIIAGCTELPIAFDHSTATAGKQYISSTHVLAEALVDACYAGTAKPAVSVDFSQNAQMVG